MKLKYIDLFAGMGGMRLGFEQACKRMNIECESVGYAEVKPRAIQVYKKVYKDSNLLGDITQLDIKNIPDFDYLLGGFPCQPFSRAGLGLGFIDTRGTLFFEIERILREKGEKVKGFILENVEGLVQHDEGRTLQIILQSLKGLGFNVIYKVLNGFDFGTPQNRKRIYIIGTRIPINLDIKEVDQKQVFSYIKEDNINDKEYLCETKLTSKLLKYVYKDITKLYGKRITDKRGGSNNIHSWQLGLKGKVTKKQEKFLNQLLLERRKSCYAKEIGVEWGDGCVLTYKQIQRFAPYIQKEDLDKLVKQGYLTYKYPKKKVNGKRFEDETKEKGYGIATGQLSFGITSIVDPNKPLHTLVATDMSRIGVIDGENLRHLTRKEGLRAFGFDEELYNLALSDLKLAEVYDLLGNTVCVKVIELLVVEMLKEERGII